MSGILRSGRQRESFGTIRRSCPEAILPNSVPSRGTRRFVRAARRGLFIAAGGTNRGTLDQWGEFLIFEPTTDFKRSTYECTNSGCRASGYRARVCRGRYLTVPDLGSGGIGPGEEEPNSAVRKGKR